MTLSMPAVFDLGGGEIILLLILLFVLVAPVAVFAAVIFLVVRAGKRKREHLARAIPPQIPPVME